MTKTVVESGLAEDGEVWLEAARTEVLAALEGAPQGLTAAQIRAAVPRIDVKVTGTVGEMWSAPRVLTQLGASADLVRGTNEGRWVVSRPRWTGTSAWLGAVPARTDSPGGYRELVRRWLFSFGPGTEDDLVWWLGATKGIVRKALSELEAVPVGLEGGAAAWLLPEDVEEVADPGPWVSLLPVLDPTVMGWQGRDFYLGPHQSRLFDTRGNVGTSAWVDGRMVGCWVQDAAGRVEVRLVEDVPGRARKALDSAAARLSAWLDGTRVGTVYRSPAMR
jgi:hypothetical protein